MPVNPLFASFASFASLAPALQSAVHSRTRRLVLVVVAINALVSVTLVQACGSEDPPSCRNSQCGPCEATVERVVDGDTIELTSGEKIRYLLVDTPETTKGKLDCYGAEAKAFNTDLVEGQVVQLDYEPDCTDMFGRLLAWVTLDGHDINAMLVERGYACVLYIAPSGADRKDELEQLQAQAKAAKKGMWGACEEVACEKD